MKDSGMPIEAIKELMSHMNSNNILKVSIKAANCTIDIESQPQNIAVIQKSEEIPAENPPKTSEKSTEISTEISGTVVKSPIVGTFYAAPAPGKSAYAPVGTTVSKGQTLFIIESMKLMNEVESEYNGEVTELLVQDGEAVEYNQPIMIIKE